MNKAIFLDRDGTINVEKNYLYKIEDFEFLPGVINALKQLQAAGYLLIIITNQSGIARGYYTERDFKKLNDWMLEELNNKGVSITRVYYCPHHPDAAKGEYRVACECRKPKLGLFYKAVEEYDIDLSLSYAIGDKIRDCAICSTTNCHGFLINNSENNVTIEQVKKGMYRNVRYVDSLQDCVREILD